MKARIILGVISTTGLIAVFLFQHWNVAEHLGLNLTNNLKFIFNRSVRFVVNDLLAIALIHALFNKRRYTIFSVYVQLVGMFFILVPYFIIKLQYPSYNGPMINFIHRLIINPMLLLLLIPALYYQNTIQNK